MSKVITALLAITVAGCANVYLPDQPVPAPPQPVLDGAATASTSSTAAAVRSQNPLLAEWTGSYGGVPPFDKVRVEDFKPALEAGMADALANIDRIANDPAAPTFENTIAALERSSRPMDRVEVIYGIWQGNMNTGAFDAVES